MATWVDDPVVSSPAQAQANDWQNDPVEPQEDWQKDPVEVAPPPQPPPSPTPDTDAAVASTFGNRKDGTPKGYGFFGPIRTPDGMDATEKSIGVQIGGQETEIPSLVPTLTQDEVNQMVSGGKPTPEIVQKARAHAEERLSRGLSPFAGENEPPVAPAGMIIPRSGAQMESLGAREFLETPQSRAAGEPRGMGDQPAFPIPRVPQQQGLLAQAAAGTVNIGSQLAEMAETPAIIASLPVAAARPIQALFSGQAFQDIRAAYQEAGQPGTTFQHGLELGGRAVLDAIFGTKMAEGAVMPHGVPGRVEPQPRVTPGTEARAPVSIEAPIKPTEGGEPNAIEQGNAQVQTPPAPLREQEGAGSGVTPAGDRYNVGREAQGAEAGGAVPQAEQVPSQRRRCRLRSLNLVR